jgi:single-stranded DNA-binding protein
MYKTILTGNLGADATVNQVNAQDGASFNVINMAVAVQLRKDVTQWVDCAFWRRADMSIGVVDYLKKGQKVLLEGEVSADVWEGKPKLKMKITNLELI